MRDEDAQEAELLAKGLKGFLDRFKPKPSAKKKPAKEGKAAKPDASAAGPTYDAQGRRIGSIAPPSMGGPTGPLPAPSPEEEADLRQRLLRAGEARSGTPSVESGGPLGPTIAPAPDGPAPEPLDEGCVDARA